MEPVQSLAQCFGSACGSSVIINGPTTSTWYKDLAEPSGMTFKVAACFLYYMQVNMAFALTLLPWSMQIQCW